MENLDIAARLSEMADLLEIRGDNPFRIRAYRDGARTVESLTRPLSVMVEEGEDLTELQGIGKDLSKYITEMVETGGFQMLEELGREVPRSLTEVVRIEGVGPKKARKLWKELDVTSVDELEEAAEAGRVEELQGFGEKSVQKIVRAIEDLRSLSGRFQISDVESLLGGLLEHVRDAPGVERVEVAGSYRRRKETIGDVDILVQAGDGEAVVEHFVDFPGTTRVEAAGDTKGSIVLRSGLQVDLRVIPGESWGAALHYFTGSKEHNVRIRKLGQKKGLKVSEWGVFEVPGDGGDGEGADDDGGGAERVAGATEEEVFAAVDLPWIVPELREDRGEIEAARQGELPELVELDDIRGDLQMHSTWSDGENTVEEMARACRERGYEYMAVTDHGPSLAMVQGLTPEKAREQWVELAEVEEAVGGIRLVRSVEVDILKDGSLDMPDEILHELDLVLVSVHSHMDQDKTTMTDRVLRALEHPAVDVFAHPTGRLINQRKAYDLDVEEVLRAAAELGVAVELNANPNRLDLDDARVYRARELGVKVVISTDAHSTRGLDNMRYGVGQARRGWLERDDVLNAAPLEEFERWLKRREEA